MRLRYASWNVGSMTGKGRELVDVLKRRRINIACLQETRWKGAKAREIGEGYKLYYSGSEGRRNGVGVVLDKDLKDCVAHVIRTSDRIITVKIVCESVILNVISVYAPQSGCKEDVKEKFWQDFDSVMIRIPESEEICIGGDFNGHVGATNEGYERVHGGWGYGNRNDDGDQLLQAATTFNLAVANTWFQKRPEHLITYKSGKHATQIDYFLIKRSKLVCVKNCKVLPGEALVTQHRLLLMDITISYKYLRRKNRLSPKIRWRMLETDEYAGRFREIMIENILEMKDMKEKSANDCWDEMANSVRKTAKAVLGESKGKGIIDKDTWWWNENVQRELKEKKNAFKKWQLERGNESERQARKNEYRECKK
ncbi:craniofacial development protein 2-like, partial [Bombyx mandarina]|uniref:Craniofacial development protein 2-like n=1 Tax=Bombyx mandarina TaxID=7092 RepID=A0A6J2KK79_BOMMA